MKTTIATTFSTAPQPHPIPALAAGEGTTATGSAFSAALQHPLILATAAGEVTR